jgi:hypothetical protein
MCFKVGKIYKVTFLFEIKDFDIHIAIDCFQINILYALLVL